MRGNVAWRQRYAEQSRGNKPFLRNSLKTQVLDIETENEKVMSDTKYILPAELINKIEALNPSRVTLLLAHGLLFHAHCLAEANTSLLRIKMSQPHIVRTSHLRDVVGRVGTKGNRWFAAALGDGRCSTIFRKLEPTENGRGLIVEYQPSFCHAATANGFDPEKSKHKYALLDTRLIGACASKTDILFYTRVAMHRRQNFPTFAIPGVGWQETSIRPPSKQFSLPGVEPKKEPTFVSWTNVRDNWLRSAKKISGLTGDHFLFRLDEGISRLGTQKVVVKVLNGETKWENARLYKCPPGSRIIAVNEDGYSYLSPEEVQLRAKAG